LENEGKEIKETKFPNESKECNSTQIPNDSKEKDEHFLNESKKRRLDDLLNESKGSDKPNESTENETAEDLEENRSVKNPIETDDIEITSRSERLKTKPQISYYEDDNSLNKFVLNAHTIFNDVPNTFDEIQYKNDKLLWKEAIKTELSSHELNNTWTITERPIHKNIEDSKWLFSVKYTELGSPTRYKARLVARGSTQKTI